MSERLIQETASAIQVQQEVRSLSFAAGDGTSAVVASSSCAVAVEKALHQEGVLALALAFRLEDLPWAYKEAMPHVPDAGFRAPQQLAAAGRQVSEWTVRRMKS